MAGEQAPAREQEADSTPKHPECSTGNHPYIIALPKTLKLSHFLMLSLQLQLQEKIKARFSLKLMITITYTNYRKLSIAALELNLDSND